MKAAMSAWPSSSRPCPCARRRVRDELAQVVLVRDERVLREAPLDPQVVEPGPQRLISTPYVHGPRSSFR